MYVRACIFNFRSRRGRWLARVSGGNAPAPPGLGHSGHQNPPRVESSNSSRPLWPRCTRYGALRVRRRRTDESKIEASSSTPLFWRWKGPIKGFCPFLTCSPPFAHRNLLNAQLCTFSSNITSIFQTRKPRSLPHCLVSSPVSEAYIRLSQYGLCYRRHRPRESQAEFQPTPFPARRVRGSVPRVIPFRAALICPRSRPFPPLCFPNQMLDSL